MKTGSLVSITIPTYNRKDMLKETLISLLKQAYPRDKFEIIVVDDGSTDGTEEAVCYLNKQYNLIKYIRQKHKNPAAARNSGIKEAMGEIIAFLDDDCIVGPNWLTLMTELHSLYPRAGAVGGPAKPQQCFFSKISDIVFLDRQAEKERWVKFIATRNISYKMQAINQIGGFDEKIGYPGEDTDLNLRLIKHGYGIYYHPALAVEHNHPLKIYSFLSREFKYGRGAYRMYCRWGEQYQPGFVVPNNCFRFIRFWLAALLRPFLILIKRTNCDIKKVFYLPFMFLGQLAHKAGIFYEMKTTSGFKT